MPSCTRCGQETPPGSRFCPNCGVPLQQERSADQTTTMSAITAVPAESESDQVEAEYAAVQEAVGQLPAGSALLIVQRGPSQGSRFLLDRDVVSAGRHPDSEIFLDDVTVSRRHVEFVRTPSGYLVRDVGSLNGTYVNRRRIDEVELTSGDEVQIGKFRLVYYAGRGGFPPSTGMAVDESGTSGQGNQR